MVACCFLFLFFLLRFFLIYQLTSWGSGISTLVAHFSGKQKFKRNSANPHGSLTLNNGRIDRSTALALAETSQARSQLQTKQQGT